MTQHEILKRITSLRERNMKMDCVMQYNEACFTVYFEIILHFEIILQFETYQTKFQMIPNFLLGLINRFELQHRIRDFFEACLAYSF